MLALLPILDKNYALPNPLRYINHFSQYFTYTHKGAQKMRDIIFLPCYGKQK